jgi:hypothetical protein
MFNQLLPRQIDDNYRGYKLALWLFAPLVLMKVGISLNSIFDGYACGEFRRRNPVGHIHVRRRTGGNVAFRDLGPFPARDLAMP